MMTIFDLDGTLINSLPMWDDMYERFLESKGVNIDTITEICKFTKDMYPDERNVHIGKILNKSDYEVGKMLIDFALDGYKNMKLYPGAKEYLRHCKCKGKVALVTANFRIVAETVLKNNNIFDLFDIIICKDDEYKETKDKVHLYIKCVNKANENISEVNIYEDSKHELTCLRKRGFKNLYFKLPDRNFRFIKLPSIEERRDLIL